MEIVADTGSSPSAGYVRLIQVGLTIVTIASREKGVGYMTPEENKLFIEAVRRGGNQQAEP